MITHEQFIIKTMYYNKELFERAMKRYEEVIEFQNFFFEEEELKNFVRFPLGDYDIIVDIIDKLVEEDREGGR